MSLDAAPDSACGERRRGGTTRESWKYVPLDARRYALRVDFENGRCAVFGTVESAFTWMKAHTERHDVRLEPSRIVDAFGHLRTL